MQEANPHPFQQAAVSVRQALARIAQLSNAMPGPSADLCPVAVAERLYAERRRRDAHFPPGLFGEPAWDLLLALYVAGEEGRQLSLTDAYRAAGVDSEAGRRVLATLEKAGLVAGDGNGGRGRSVGLTGDGAARLSDYLTELL